MAHFRPLSQKGKDKIGHIFDMPEMVPLRQHTPVSAKVNGEDVFMWLVDWKALSDGEQERVLEYMVNKFNVDDQEPIREQFEKDGYFALQWEYINEAYDHRFLI